ncbi:polysaccharide biosynthesis tyrosine autokinase [Nitrosomonas sp.]|uniref:polysaccharide biosynthesis tyrosine autokinase n=1 Tax=Nitrosomonas sp. TaxID=42353 RepID=UPI0026187170|nr:polysaccharide biosynthesis tyrosine autokinase [Nitrosomonas sp.]MCW5600374.1 polysaccharide biosynthesis tyrosine autokinase [Nitrosomonas sp.]
MTPNTPNDHAKAQLDYQFDQDDDEINLGEVLGILLDSKWLIICITFVALSLGVAKTFLDRPVYKADGLLQAMENKQTLAGLEPLTSLVDSKTPVMAEIELIKSRMILGKTIQSLHLDIVAKPKYFPIIGEAIARQFEKRNPDNAVSNPLFDQIHYAWGGEAIQVDTFAVPADWEDEELILQAGKQGHFKLIRDDEIILEGEVGKLASKQLEGEKNSVSIFVSLLKARPDTYFTVMRLSKNQAIRHLRNSISVAEKSKNTGILELTVESHSPDAAVSIVNEIANIYVQQNVDQKSAESQKTLEFLEKQLPILKDQLEAATVALNEYRTRQGSIDLDLETQNILKSAVELRTQITLLQQKRDELRQRYTESHPTIISIDKQIARLQSQITAHENKIGVLPETQQVILRLSRDVQVSTELYTTLLNNAQTLRIAKAGTIGNVRIIDYALLPDEPIKPKKLLIIGIACILGIILGVVTAFLRRLLNRGVEDPHVIEKQLNVPVYATVPHSKSQKALYGKLKKLASSRHYTPVILALENREDIAIESLRSLRTTLHFAFLEARNNIIMITGPSPNIGKTFISVNLAVVMADAGKKVLLIDGDMRRGLIHKPLGLGRDNGLSELIFDAIKIEEAIHHIPQANIDFIPTGAIPPNPSELLLHERFGHFLENISTQYDLVIIDSPPILAVTDAAIIGRLASATLMVVKAGEHPMRELEQSTKRLIQAGTRLKGIVFNDLPQVSARHGYSYGKYVYQYSYKKGK